MADQDTATPTLRRLVEQIIEAKLSQLVLGPMPGKVTAYNHAKQTASVQPLVARVYFDEDKRRRTQSRPVCQDVPILFVGGNGTRITTGLAKGDYVLLIPCGVSISRWLIRGGEVDPGDARGAASDVVALAGLQTLSTPLSTAPAGAITLHANDVRLGSDAATNADDRVVRRKFLTALRTALGTASISTGAGGAADIIAKLDLAIGDDFEDSAATRVKAK